MEPQNLTTEDGTTLDPKVLKVVRAIRDIESGGDYNAVGDNGKSHGAYQWNKDNFKNAAREILKDENAPMTPANQNKVAYYQVKAYKDAGKTPEEIAALWNGAHKDKETNQYTYNNPEYGNKFRQAILRQQNKSSQPDAGTPDSNGYITSVPVAPTTDQTKLPDTQTQNDSLGTELKNRAGDVSTAVSDTLSGKINPISGLLQGAGAIAGGIGDVVNKGIELIPGVKQLEGLLGQGIGALAKTDAGKAVAKSVSDFSNEHPELAKDIGAGFNIVTAIPILRGLGTVTKLGLNASSQALKSIAEKSFIQGAPDLIASTKAGARFLESRPNVLKDMVDRRLVGDIKGGEYLTQDAINASEKTIKDLNSQLKTVLDRPEYSQVGQDGNSIAQKAIDGFTDRNGNVIEGFKNSGMTAEELIANAKKLDPTNKLLWDKFEAGQANWKEINELRSALDGKVKKVFIQGAGLDAPEVATSKELGAGLSSAMRDTLQSTIPSTSVPFKEMTTQFNIQKALGYMDGKKVQPGGIAKFAGHLAGGGAGGMVGGMIGGAPGAMVGGMIGDKTAGTIANTLAKRKVVQGVLKRTGQNAAKVSKQELKKKLGGLFGGTVTQKVTKPK